MIKAVNVAMLSLVACLVLDVTQASWEPAPLRLSDLPTYHFDRHVAHDTHPVIPSASHPGGNSSLLVPHSICSHYSDCIKCSDNVLCSWCQAPGDDAEAKGACVLTSRIKDQCLNLGGKSGPCPFFTKNLAITTVTLATLILLASGGGIGGGALFIPILLLVYGLTAHQAVPLSKIMIFGNAIGSFSVLYSKRHPQKDAPLIDYDFSMLLVPGILLGTILGVYLNVIFPAFVIGISLAVLVTITSYRTWTKGLSLYYRELRENRDDDSLTEVIELDPMSSSGQLNQPLINDALQPILERERSVPWYKFATLFVTWAGLVVIVLLKGGGGGQSIIGVTCGSPGFFVILLAAIPFLMGLSAFVGRRLLREHMEKCIAGYQFLEYDLQYNLRTVVIVPLLGVLAGTAAGFLGIGAGLVVGPICLEMGLMPEVTQATSSFTILFTSSSTSLQFMLLGKLPVEAAVWFFCVGFVFSIFGQNLVSCAIDKVKRQSFIIFFLAIMITLSAVFMTADSIYRIAEDGFAGSFHNPCASAIS